MFFADITNLILLFLMIVSGSILLAPIFKGTDPLYVPTLEATRLLNKNQAYIWDIRSEEAFAEGSIIRAKNMPIEKWDQLLTQSKLKKDKPIILIADNGLVPRHQLKKLTDAGFTEVKVLSGGLSGWKSAGLPIVKKTN